VIAAIGIITVWLTVIGTVVFVAARRRSREASKVTLQYRSGTTVTLEATEVPRASAAAVARGSAPAIRRRLPGLMPTAGHVVVPKTRPSQMRPIPAMSFDET